MSAETCATLIRHPSARVFDRAVDAIISSVEALSVYKQIDIEPAQYENVARFALGAVPLRTLRGLIRAEPRAVQAAYFAINHALDVIAVARLITISRVKSDMPPLADKELVAAADRALRNRFANDRPSPAMIWENPASIVARKIGCQAQGSLASVSWMLPSAKGVEHD